MDECIYRTYAELAAAFESGELINRDDYVLTIDNNCCRLSYIGNEMDESEAYDHCKALFRGNGYSDIVEVCEAAGIPAEWC